MPEKHPQATGPPTGSIPDRDEAAPWSLPLPQLTSTPTSSDASPQADASPPQPPRLQRGKAFWRSLDELADTDEFRRWRYHEFPAGVVDQLDGMSRRRFLKIMAASFALGGASFTVPGCGAEWDRDTIAPDVREPVDILPGRPLFFATATTRSGYTSGLLVQSHTGRPTKIEGNPEHPANLGATDVFAQAEILTFYDPERSQAVYRGSRISTWERFGAALTSRLAALRRANGRGLRLLTGEITSPTLLAQINELLEVLPEARWHAYEPVTRQNERAGTQLAFGRELDLVYRFERADRILSLDADFLFAMPGSVRYAHDFADRRRVRRTVAGELQPAEMNRLYVIEPTPTITGSKADHRLPLPASQVGAAARFVARELGVDVPGPAGEVEFDESTQQWLRVVAEDLRERPGRSLVIAGASQPPAVQALALAMNDLLGNVGETVYPIEPVGRTGEQTPRGIEELVQDMAAGEVEALVMLDVNPVYDTAVDLQFTDRLAEVPFRVHMGLYRNETARLCDWHLPLTHELEAWSDGRAFDGTATIIQPLIDPLYRNRTAHELLARMVGAEEVTSYDLVRQTWQRLSGLEGEAFEQWWRQVLRLGLVPDSSAPPVPVTLDRAAVQSALAQAPPAEPITGFEIVYKPDPTIWDGRYANNAWLQELHKPMTKLTWDNALLLSPAAAKALGVEAQQIVEVRYRGVRLPAAVWLMPGQHDRVATLSLGYGRWATGFVGQGLGFNAYRLRRSDALWFDDGIELVPQAERYQLATTQNHHAMEGRDHIRTGTLAEFREEPGVIAHELHLEDEVDHQLSLLPEWEYEGYQWGMTIDLTTCIGCAACTIACQAENNIPVVGKEQVIIGREMYWIRVDRMFAGPPEEPEIFHQPVPCMHCEKAPCELVCPVAATKHSHDGLNEMIYNCCIGIRYCSNNCPYKVRRFNFYRYWPPKNQTPPQLQMLFNPEVTVRGRGVMEKCTYCVQRIRTAEIQAKTEDRPLFDHEVVTACQQACPTNAIIFGDINDPDTRVAFTKRQPHNYGVLTELNTQPRTTYLAAIRNPHPALAVPIEERGFERLWPPTNLEDLDRTPGPPRE